MRRTEFGSGGPLGESLALPADRLGFVRRQCPECRRPFKIKGARLDSLSLLRRIAGQVAHLNAHETVRAAGSRHCPYCRFAAPEESFLTPEQQAFLDQRAEAFSLELRYEMLAHVERTLADNPNPTFLAVRPEPSKTQLADEPNDMRVLPLLCCREELKLPESWPGPVCCFFCGAVHELQAPLVHERLSRLLH